MDYTKISPLIAKDRDEMCVPPEFGQSVSLTEAKKNIGYFMYHQLGMKPYKWQYLAFRNFQYNKKHQLWCTARQYMGKSTALDVIALHSVIYNLYPIETKGNKTIIGIISKTEEQSKKMIADIRNLMYKGDDHIEKITGGKVKGFFSSYLSNKHEYTQSKTELTFVHPKTEKIVGQIICLPPTERVRGYTFSHILLDEVAFFDDDEFFLTIAQPTLNMTKGNMVLASTPNGQRGFFFKVFDPFDLELEHNDFDRLWFDYTYIENPEDIERVMKIREMYERAGMLNRFEQEYGAKFTSAINNFFDSELVDKCVDAGLSRLTEYSKPTDMGVDFGMVQSRTVITISRLGEDGVIRLVYHYVYPVGQENSLVLDIKELIPLFNCQRIIVDNCPEGYHFIQRMEEEGLNVKPMTFKKDKVAKYGQFRAAMANDKLKFYKFPELMTEMKAMEEEDTPRSTRISKPSGGTDDIVDSFVMSCYFFLDKSVTLKIYKWDEEIEQESTIAKAMRNTPVVQSRWKKWFGKEIGE